MVARDRKSFTFSCLQDDVRGAKIPDAKQVSRMNGFHMQLKSVVTFGAASVALFFTVVSSGGEQSPDTVIVSEP